MKYKKYSYIIVLILMLLVGINKTNAFTLENYYYKTCYYIGGNNEAMAQLTIKWDYTFPYVVSGKSYSEVYFQYMGGKPENDDEPIINWYDNFKDGATGLTLKGIYSDRGEANKNPSCPAYLIMRSTNDFGSYGAFATQSELEAKKFVEASKQKNYKAWYLTHTRTDENGIEREITKEEYWAAFDQYIEGESNVDFDAMISCTDLFGDENDENSLAYMINMVLGYVRIIVPILVIVLGLFDLGKAVIAGKEDDMKKAQTTFIKRIVIGVVVFFIPLVVNLVMDLADIVWEGMGYSICEFK